MTDRTLSPGTKTMPPSNERLQRLRVLATSSVVGTDLAWLLTKYDQLRGSLLDLYNGTAEYVYLNNLGDPHNTTPMRNAAEVLGVAYPRSLGAKHAKPTAPETRASPDAWLVLEEDGYRFLSGGEGQARERMSQHGGTLHPLYRSARAYRHKDCICEHEYDLTVPAKANEPQFILCPCGCGTSIPWPTSAKANDLAYVATCAGGTGGPCTQPDCEKCWPDPPSQTASEPITAIHGCVHGECPRLPVCGSVCMAGRPPAKASEAPCAHIWQGDPSFCARCKCPKHAENGPEQS